MKKLEKNGLLYLSFPNESSIHFPRRIGTLNFFDDNTHAKQPPILQSVEKIIQNNNCIIIKKATPNKIFIGYLLGINGYFIIQPNSNLIDSINRTYPNRYTVKYDYFYSQDNISKIQISYPPNSSAYNRYNDMTYY